MIMVMKVIITIMLAMIVMVVMMIITMIMRKIMAMVIPIFRMVIIFDNADYHSENEDEDVVKIISHLLISSL